MVALQERGGGGIFLQTMVAPVRSRILAESLRSSLRSIVHTCQSPWLTANGNSKCKNINIIFASDAALALRNQFPDFFGNSVSESTGTESGRAHSVSHRNCSNGCGKPPSLSDSVAEPCGSWPTGWLRRRRLAFDPSTAPRTGI